MKLLHLLTEKRKEKKKQHITLVETERLKISEMFPTLSFFSFSWKQNRKLKIWIGEREIRIGEERSQRRDRWPHWSPGHSWIRFWDGSPTPCLDYPFSTDKTELFSSWFFGRTQSIFVFSPMEIKWRDRERSACVEKEGSNYKINGSEHVSLKNDAVRSQ